MSNRRPLRLIALAAGVASAAALAACAPAPQPVVPPGAPTPAPLPDNSPRNGLEVIRWMRFMYPSRELKSLAFTVVSSSGDQDSTTRAARAYAALPGRIRVDDLPKAKRSGIVRDHQRLSVFRAGRRVARATRVDLRTLVTYDLFAQGLDTTVMWLDSARVRFGVVRRDRFAGRSVWVVGAEKGDLSSAQFWVDADRWRVVRVIQPEPRTPSVISDVRYTDFTELQYVPVPTRAEIWRDGALVERQEYFEFVVNPTLPPGTFNLARWRTVSLGG